MDLAEGLDLAEAEAEVEDSVSEEVWDLAFAGALLPGPMWA